MAKEKTSLEIAMEIMRAQREKMRAKCGGVGEPAVYLPVEHIRTFTDSEGATQAILAMDQFVYLVDRVLRS